jgi:nitric oxide dioxygenase
MLTLSEKSRPVIEATLPVVGEHIGAIAERFYDHLFTEHPELLDGTFNRGNQAEGSQQQALAGSVAIFAEALLNHPEHLPERLLTRVGHKHASLGIRPDQYQVVYDNLMWAIGDVLGDAVTPEVAEAWSEVYWVMAFALISTERGLYSARGVQPETVWREWRVTDKVTETADVATFKVRRIDDRPVRTSLPGQYVSVLMPMPDGTRQPRQYSLTRADDGEHRQFSVKRVSGGGQPDGEVSNLMHEAVEVGDVITLSLPFGDVVLDDSGRPLVFCSAGIGITPMAGMLSHLVVAGSSFDVRAARRPRRGLLRAPRAGAPRRTRAAQGRHARVVRARRRGLAAGRQPPRRDDGPVPGRAAGRRRLLPLRSAAVHAGGAVDAHRPRRPEPRHPVRGVRPGPVAGRHRVTRGDGGAASLDSRIGP